MQFRATLEKDQKERMERPNYPFGKIEIPVPDVRPEDWGNIWSFDHFNLRFRSETSERLAHGSSTFSDRDMVRLVRFLWNSFNEARSFLLSDEKFGTYKNLLIQEQQI